MEEPEATGGADCLCVFSIIRYVADPIRDEPRNIGVIVLCDEPQFVAARYRLRASGLPPGSQRFDFLQRYMDAIFSTRSAALLTRETLTKMAENYTNLIQFTRPCAALTPDPARLLDDLYRERVARRRLLASERPTIEESKLTWKP